MILRPIPIKRALLLNELMHRRLPKLQGAMWAIQLLQDSDVLGVALVGRPTARFLDNGSNLQVLRCAVIPGTKNGCSMLYGACSRASQAMGAEDLLTYIHEDEHGISLKASNWILDRDFKSCGGEWGRPSRPREKTVEADSKLRYWAPWGVRAKLIKSQQAPG